MISNVRLRVMAVNPKNEWVIVRTVYDGPSLEDALTLAIRGIDGHAKIPGITFSHAMSLYEAWKRGSEGARYTLTPGLRIDITVRGNG